MEEEISEKKLKLVTSDGEIIEVDKRFVNVSKIIKQTFDDS